MKENSLFNPTRFFLLVRNDVEVSLSGVVLSRQSIQARTIGLIILSLLSVAGFTYWISTYTAGPFFDEALLIFLNRASITVLFTLGWFLTGVAFKELHSSQESYGWLTLPGSLLEKYVSRLILTSLGFVILAAISYELYAAALIGFTRLFFSHIAIPFDPFDRGLLDCIAYYLVLHSLFVLGAVIFKQLAHLKTILVILAVICTVAILGNRYAGAYGIDVVYDPEMAPFRTIIHIAFWGLQAPVAWLIGFLLMKRKEA